MKKSRSNLIRIDFKPASRSSRKVRKEKPAQVVPMPIRYRIHENEYAGPGDPGWTGTYTPPAPYGIDPEKD